MNRQMIEKYVRQRTYQISNIYKQLFNKVGATSLDFEQATASAMVEMGLAKNIEHANILINAVLIGMSNAENRLADSLNQLTPSTIEASPLVKGLFGDELSLADLGQVVELREILINFVDEKSYNETDTQAFTQLTEQEQLHALGELYQKALDKTANIGLSEFEHIVDDNLKPGQMIDEHIELLYAIAVAHVLKKSNLPMEAYDIYESVGTYTHTAIYVINKNAEALRVEPVFSERAIEIGTWVLTIAFVVLFSAIIGHAAGSPNAFTTATTSISIPSPPVFSDFGDVKLYSKQIVRKDSVRWLRFLTSLTPLIACYVVKPIMYKSLQAINTIMTKRKQSRYNQELIRTQAEADYEEEWAIQKTRDN